MKWWERERGAKRARILPSLPAIPKCSQTHKKCSARREKKKIKGKGGEVRVAGPSLGTSECSEAWGPPGLLP